MSAVMVWVIQVFDAGGWVMYPLLLLSVCSLSITIERVLFWISPSGGRRPSWGAGLPLARTEADFSVLVKGDSSVYGAFVRDLLGKRRSPAGALDAVECVRPRIERFASILSTIVTAAPMIGILGTVVGIIDSFRLLGGADSIVVDPAQVAGGIAKALLTTAFGLTVAITTLFPYVLFRAAADRCFNRLEVAAATIIELVGDGDNAGDGRPDAPATPNEGSAGKKLSPATPAVPEP